MQESFEGISKTCERMEKALQEGPWLVGPQFSFADIIVAPLIDRMDDLGFADIWEGEFPPYRGLVQSDQGAPLLSISLLEAIELLDPKIGEFFYR